MKAREILILIFIVLLIISGCREISVTTEVHRDGSFTRIIRITGDSSSVCNGDLPYPVDSTWSRTLVKDSAGESDQEDQYILTYTKLFSNSRELMGEIVLDTGWRSHLERQIDVSSRFGFFYSYLTFKEVFQPANPFTFLPYQDYLTAEDLDWLSGQKSVISQSDSSRFEKIEEKAEKFITTSVTAELEQLLTDAVIRLNDPALVPEEVVRFHDSIQRYVEAWEFDQPEKFMDYLQAWTGNPLTRKLVETDPKMFDGIMKKMVLFNNLVMMESYSETIEMPGVIIATNSAMLNGNRVSWEVQPPNLLFVPYELTVESRVVNNWAFVVTGIILILLVVVLAWKGVKK